MALSLNNLGVGNKDGTPSRSIASMLPAFLAEQPVIQQMKTLGGVFVVLLVAIAILVFIFIIAIGYIYAWKKRVLEWK